MLPTFTQRLSLQQLAYINLKRPDKSTTQGSHIQAGPVTQVEPELLKIIIPGQKKPWVFTNHLTNAEWLTERATLRVKLRAKNLHKVICEEILVQGRKLRTRRRLLCNPRCLTPNPSFPAQLAATPEQLASLRLHQPSSSVVTETRDSEVDGGDEEGLPPRQGRNRQKATS